MFDVTAHEASADELDRYWPGLTRIWPAYQSFYDSGGARSVFLLERVRQQLVGSWLVVVWRQGAPFVECTNVRTRGAGQ